MLAQANVGRFSGGHNSTAINFISMPEQRRKYNRCAPKASHDRSPDTTYPDGEAIHCKRELCGACKWGLRDFHLNARRESGVIRQILQGKLQEVHLTLPKKSSEAHCPFWTNALLSSLELV